MLMDFEGLIERYVESDPRYPSDNKERAMRIVALTSALKSVCSAPLLGAYKEKTARHLLNGIIVECCRFVEGLDTDNEIMITEPREEKACETNF